MKQLSRVLVLVFLIAVFLSKSSSGVLAVTVDEIKEQVRAAAEQRHASDTQNNESATGSNARPGSKPNSTPPMSQQNSKKPHTVTKKVLHSWFNGKVTLESHDGLWVIIARF